MTRTARVLVLATLVAAAACGGDGGTDPRPRTGFTAHVSGATSATLTGEAGYLVTPNMVTIALHSGSGASYIQFARQGGLPGAGTYQLRADTPANSGDFVAFYAGGATENYVATSGTLTITSSSADRVKGTFNFTATGGASGTSTVAIDGDFDAPRLAAP
ncbi:MAG TPA: hypothetical protein VF761_19880 [Gemmatimonadaceae bacterium]